MNRRSLLQGLASVATTAAFGLGFARRKVEWVDDLALPINRVFDVGDTVFVSGFDACKKGYRARVVSRYPLTLSAVDRPAPRPRHPTRDG